MRIFRGTDYPFSMGTGEEFVCAIEILTTTGNEEHNQLFYDYAQVLLDRWLGIADKYGVKDSSRPHWGKTWQKNNVGGEDIYSHLRKVCPLFFFFLLEFTM